MGRSRSVRAAAGLAPVFVRNLPGFPWHRARHTGVPYSIALLRELGTKTLYPNSRSIERLDLRREAPLQRALRAFRTPGLCYET